MKTITDIEDYFRQRVAEIKSISKNGSPWEFLCMSAFLEYLCKLVNGEDKGSKGYKAFIIDYLAVVNPQYKSFTYKSGLQDLNVQMYHILRCGAIHSFSLYPDAISLKNGGRLQSIALGHRTSGCAHLSSYSSPKVIDAALFISEDFAEDIEKLVDHIFNKAKTCPDLELNIVNWFNLQEPICADV